MAPKTERPDGEAIGRPSAVAIVGSGMGGVATAWLCDSGCTIDLFESRPKVGGHCDSRVIDYRGHPITVDLGAQFFHPDTHPTYWCLIRALGLESARIRARASLGVKRIESEKSLFLSTRPLRTPINAMAFAFYAVAARRLILNDGSFELTLDDWLGGLKLPRYFKRDIVAPLIAAFIGTSVENARRSSARSILQTVALAFPRNVMKGAETWNFTIGLEGPITRMLESCRNATLYLSTRVTALEWSDAGWFVHAGPDRKGPYKAVVLNAMPHASRGLLKEVPWAGDVVNLLSKYEYFKARLAIHTDPLYVPADRRDWAVYNAGIEGEACEGSVWLGGIHPSGLRGPVDIFKSWISSRRRQPRELLLDREFDHPLITPDVIRAAHKLKDWQGFKGLWFAGQHTAGMDLQETALRSAMNVAKKLNPESPQLRTLEHLVTEAGRLPPSADL